MNAVQRLAQLLEEGACIQMHEPDVGVFLLGHAQFMGPGEFKWCIPWPEDQHHTHFIEYADARLVVKNIYIQFFDAGETLLATIGPCHEFDYDDKDFGGTLASWREALSPADVRKRFLVFFKEA